MIMSTEKKYVLYDSVKLIRSIGEYEGSIISKCRDSSIIFSDNAVITENQIKITEGLWVGFELESNKKVAFSKKVDLYYEADVPQLLYSIIVPTEIMTQYDEGQFSDAFPFTLTMLHTAGLYLNDHRYRIDHLDFFIGEILKNPVALIHNGICVADRVVIDHKGDPVFYDCLIVGRDQYEDLKVSYEPLVFVDDKIVEYIVILGIETLKE